MQRDGFFNCGVGVSPGQYSSGMNNSDEGLDLTLEDLARALFPALDVDLLNDYAEPGCLIEVGKQEFITSFKAKNPKSGVFVIGVVFCSSIREPSANFADEGSVHLKASPTLRVRARDCHFDSVPIWQELVDYRDVASWSIQALVPVALDFGLVGVMRNLAGRAGHISPYCGRASFNMELCRQKYCHEKPNSIRVEAGSRVKNAAKAMFFPHSRPQA